MLRSGSTVSTWHKCWKTTFQRSAPSAVSQKSVRQCSTAGRCRSVPQSYLTVYSFGPTLMGPRQHRTKKIMAWPKRDNKVAIGPKLAQRLAGDSCKRNSAWLLYWMRANPTYNLLPPPFLRDFHNELTKLTGLLHVFEKAVDRLKIQSLHYPPTPPAWPWSFE